MVISIFMMKEKEYMTNKNIKYDNSGLDEDGFMKIPELITELPFLERKDKEPTPWYKDMLGNYLFSGNRDHLYGMNLIGFF